ncbi:hypothetical protein [Microbacterium sp. NPDC096154]|uniref:hypothetical protein n=1 Tax=Microbacterium sp. NPDC096154 TaxID=3155549 RepID=UPI00332A5226
MSESRANTRRARRRAAAKAGVGRRAAVTAGASAALAAGLTFGALTAAEALWAATDTASPAAMRLGDVSFAGQPGDGSAQPGYSEGGAPVTVTIPAAEIIRVLDQTGPADGPVIWRFQAEGLAEGITGLTYDVTPLAQVTAAGSTDLTGGVAAPGTVLAHTTMKVYPESTSGDCSAVPATPEGDSRNVIVYDGDDHVLHEPGAGSPQPRRVQGWCVAMSFRTQPDGAYRNDVFATGLGADGSPVTAGDQWRGVVAYPPSLDADGEYRARVDASGTAEDQTVARNSDDWLASLYPDPSAEPAVALQLDPTVTSVRPDVPPGDHYVAP